MNYGGFWIRFLAYIVDSAIITIGFIVIVGGLALMGLELFSPTLIYFIICVLYWALMQSSARQATIGKALVGLKVTDLSGARLTPLRSLARELAKIISSLTLLIGYVIAAFTGKKQALHDFVASTVVVRAAPGRILVAVVVAVLALFSPVIVIMLFGAAMLTAALAPMAAMMGGQETVVQVKPAAPAPTPTPTPGSTPAPAATPAAPAPAAATPAAPAPTPVAAAPAAAKPAAAPAAPATPAPATPAPAAAAKPAVVPVAATPAKLAQAEPAKPVMKEPAKPVAEEPAKEEPVTAAPPPAEDKPAAAPRKAPAEAPMRVVAGPVYPGPKFNDLVTAVLYRDAKAVNDLLALGKWPDKPDSVGMTPLMIAASQGDSPIAEALLKAGANPNLTGPGGATALSLARERKDAALVGLLQNHGAR